VDTQNGQLHDNRIVFNDTSSEFSTAVNVGPETVPSSFSFARNRWLNLANPTPAGSTPSLPTAETDGVYGGDPMAPIDAAHVWDFAWGKWIVNANSTQESVDIANYQSFRRAIAASGAIFQPLAPDPLVGIWSSQAIPAATIQLPAFSQVILIDPSNCANCIGTLGDYDSDGIVDEGDFNIWRSAFASTLASADGNSNAVVDAADYVLWRKLTLTTAGSSSIPDPAPIMLGWLAWAAIRRRHARQVFATSPSSVPQSRTQAPPN